MKRNLLNSIVLGGAMVFGANAVSANQNAYRAKENIHEGVRMAQAAIGVGSLIGGRRGYHAGRVFVAVSYKLRMAESDVLALRESNEKRAVLNALQVAREKIADRRLDMYQRLDFLEDCADVAIRNLNQIIRYGGGGGHGAHGLERSMSLMRDAVQLTRQGQYYHAEDALYAAAQQLRRYPQEASLDGAMNAIRVSLEKLRDRRLSHRERVAFLEDCCDQFLRMVRESRAYRSGRF